VRFKIVPVSTLEPAVQKTITVTSKMQFAIGDQARKLFLPLQDFNMRFEVLERFKQSIAFVTVANSGSKSIPLGSSWMAYSS
jgi:hypothetical protein